MIERVARASFACWRKRMDDLGMHQDKGREFEDMNESEHEFALMNACAMIEAMREPTAEMTYDRRLLDVAIYIDMIDAALKE